MLTFDVTTPKKQLGTVISDLDRSDYYLLVIGP